MLRRFAVAKPLLRRYNLHSATKELLQKMDTLEVAITQFKTTHSENFTLEPVRKVSKVNDFIVDKILPFCAIVAGLFLYLSFMVFICSDNTSPV